jgi:leucyl-tRNA synthetase
MEYNFKEIESNWQAYWAKHKTFAAKDGGDKPKYYVLDMFPYPSGAGLHVGHPLGYIASDIVSRYKRHKGFNVLHPMGYDSFGLPAEQYAIQTGQHPKVTTENNIAVYRRQLDKIGFSFDWDREVRTSNPEYYKWTQWIFIQIFNSWYNKDSNKAENISALIAEFEANGNAKVNAVCEGTVKSFTAKEWKAFTEKEQSDILMNYRLAYLGEAYVNWCPQLGTVLANDEIKDGVSERGGYPVERKLMKQWSMRITAYAQRLLDGLDTLDWTDSLKEAQRNWIGKSEGTSLQFKIHGSDKTIEVFTTRPDTVFGVSFVTLAPEHELVESLTTADNKAEVEAYVTQAKNRSERERQADINKITGVFTGSYVEHPFTGKQVPIWIGDYVLAGYGTGAVMAVPAHDSRDYSFAKHFGLPILEVVAATSNVTLSGVEGSYDAKEGKLINSDFLNGLEVKEAIKKAIAEIEAKGLGKGKVNFRLRDAVFGRQRYWGEPIPVYYKNDIPYALDESELPLILPEVDKYLPTEDGEPPLARATNWRYKPLSSSPQGGEDTKPHNWQTAADSSYNFTKDKSQELRKNQTEAEQILWEAIRKKSLEVKFRRQHIIGVNIVDFVCLDHKLVIEVDGKIHLDQKEYDAERTKQLESIGFSVIRFTNEEIIHDIEKVISKIKLKLDELPKVLPSGEDLGGASYPYEHSTMPGWAGSSWYFLRYMDSTNASVFADKKLSDYWQQVDLYIGGSEHATGHLLYVRFWTKFLKDLGYIAIDEPAKKLINQGMIQGRSNFVYRVNGENKLVSSGLKNNYEVSALHVDVSIVNNDILDVEAFKKWRDDFKNADFILEDGKYICGAEVEKMSKSKYNVVTPDDISEKFGSDTLRLYEMFLGPLEQSKPWNTNGITGVHGFLKKMWRLFYSADGFNVVDAEPTKGELKTLHKTIKKITEDIDRFSFNTSISNFMICVNELTDAKCNKRAILEPLLICLSPYAPHITEELWKQLGHTESISTAPFPDFNEAFLVDDTINYPVSFNGKVKFTLELAATLTAPEVEAIVRANEQTAKYLDGKEPKKVIVVHKKIVNMVV